MHKWPNKAINSKELLHDLPDERFIRKAVSQYLRFNEFHLMDQALSLFLKHAKEYEIAANRRQPMASLLKIEGWIDPRFVKGIKSNLKADDHTNISDVVFHSKKTRSDVAKVHGKRFLRSGFGILGLESRFDPISLAQYFDDGFQYRPNFSTQEVKSTFLSATSKHKDNKFWQLAAHPLFYVDNCSYFNVIELKLEKDKFRIQVLEKLAAFHFETLSTLLKFTGPLSGIELLCSTVPRMKKPELLYLLGSNSLSKLDSEDSSHTYKIHAVNRTYADMPAEKAGSNYCFPSFTYTGNVGLLQPGTTEIMGDQLSLRKISDATVIHGGTILSEGFLNVVDRGADPRIENVSGQWDHVTGSPTIGDHALLKLPKSPASRFSKGILISGRNDNNWYHWMIEYLPRILEIDTFLPIEIPVVISSRVPDTGFSALELLTDRPIEIVDAKKMCTFSELYVCSPNSSIIDTLLAPWEHLTRFNIENLLEMRKRLIANLEPPRFPSRVFLKRSSNHRKLINSVRLEQLALKEGISIISLEDLNLDDQINLFAHADQVVSQGGAVMANYLLMKPKSTLIQLNSSVNKDFVIPAVISQLAGARLISVIGKVDKKDFRGVAINQIHASYSIASRDFRNAINS